MNFNYLQESLLRFEVSIAEFLKLEENHELVDAILELAFQQFTKDLASKIDEFLKS